MSVVLSQRIDTESEYDDVPFQEYHFPRRYRRQLRTGDRFIYYQGNKSRRDHRYYFGHGVVGKIDQRADDGSFVAKILDGLRFVSPVPIYNPDGGFYESLGFAEIRKSESPPWQRSIRPISTQAFETILAAANSDSNLLDTYSQLELTPLPFDVLDRINARYSGLEPQLRNLRITKHLDRGVAVTNALKSILGANCQICHWTGFEKPDGDGYIEAHHLCELAERQPNSLCTDNIILVCPNCHRELHHGVSVSVVDQGDSVLVQFSDRRREIRKNTVLYLRQVLSQG